MSAALFRRRSHAGAPVVVVPPARVSSSRALRKHKSLTATRLFYGLPMTANAVLFSTRTPPRSATIYSPRHRQCPPKTKTSPRQPTLTELGWRWRGEVSEPSHPGYSCLSAHFETGDYYHQNKTARFPPIPLGRGNAWDLDMTGNNNYQSRFAGFP